MFLNFRKHPRFHSLRSWTEVARPAIRRFTVVRPVHSLVLLVVLIITVFRQARFRDDVSDESRTIITIFLVLRDYLATLTLTISYHYARIDFSSLYLEVLKYYGSFFTFNRQYFCYFQYTIYIYEIFVSLIN